MCTACYGYQPLQPMPKRRHSDTPRLLNQPTVPEPPPTQIYHDFVATVPDQSGKLAVVTGSNSGLGYWAARTLAYRGASVILACRSMEKGEAARERMLVDLAEHGVASAKIRVMFLDLSSFSQVREFGQKMRRSERKIDLLLNNAGVMGVLRYDTEDGWDVQLQVNHLGHFLLTHELLPMLVKAPDGGRIVQHASLAQRSRATPPCPACRRSAHASSDQSSRPTSRAARWRRARARCTRPAATASRRGQRPCASR